MNSLSSSQADYLKNMSSYVARFNVFSDDVCLFIACQFALESNFGKSFLCHKQFNSCGMKRPKTRPTTDISSDGVFAEYGSYLLNFIDYLLWISYCHFTQKDCHNLDLFKKKIVALGYCPESDYINRIINIYNIYQNERK